MSEFKMKKPKRRGCPLKYAYCVGVLKEDALYSAACIVEAAIIAGLLDPDGKALQRRVRMSFNKLKNAREFPKTGHGLVRRRGQRPTPGFKGRLWMDATDYRTFFSGGGSSPRTRKPTSYDGSDLPF